MKATRKKKIIFMKNKCDELKQCIICPRKCKVNRTKSVGFCKASVTLKIALASLHEWEEPCISGTRGSGAIFFSYCNLRCVYCQNYKISRGFGKEVSIERFSEICLELQNEGAHNINLVTPTHYIPQIIDGIKKAKSKGLNIPIVYNTGGYELVDSIKKLNGIVDIYLTDLKYYADLYGEKYSNAKKYFEVASSALDEMFNQVGKNIIEAGIMKRGIIVRVLLLPGLVEDAKKIVEYLYDKYKDNIFISIMNQYTPVRDTPYPELNRKVDKKDYDELVDYAYDLGIRNAFIQEDDASDLCFVPNFDKRGV